MNCEIEFLPVGERSKAGDAIVVRYGEANSYELMTIDGGTAESGKALVEHIRSQFGKNSAISHAVLTHSDADHACGLREIISELPVKNLWLHLPWLSAATARPYFSNKGWTDAGLAEAIRKEYDLVDEIFKLAQAKKTINIRQPFAGAEIGPFRVLSPRQDVYNLLLPQFDRTPDADQAVIEATGLWIGKAPGPIAKMIDKVAAKIQKWVPESWDKELLRDGGVTSASNESSVVLYGDFAADRRVLLTGDAGVWALSLAAAYAKNSNLPLQAFTFVQVPHHGSRRNVGPTTLNRLLGPIQQEGSAARFSAYVSAPKDDDTHPRRMVLNAFTRRGGAIFATQGQKRVHWGGFRPREGYYSVEPTPFSPQVEDYD
jgi:beta-lactamase superfamily II metal-dependent hydrolase